jgi:hypothetical protein
MLFFGRRAPAAAPESVVPDDAALLQEMCISYSNPGIESTEAMHSDVLARKRHWRVSLKRVRKLLCKVVNLHEQGACAELEVGEWCLVTAPAATSVAEIWPQRSRSRLR